MVVLGLCGSTTNIENLNGNGDVIENTVVLGLCGRTTNIENLNSNGDVIENTQPHHAVACEIASR